MYFQNNQDRNKIQRNVLFTLVKPGKTTSMDNIIIIIIPKKEYEGTEAPGPCWFTLSTH